MKHYFSRIPPISWDLPITRRAFFGGCFAALFSVVAGGWLCVGAKSRNIPVFPDGVSVSWVNLNSHQVIRSSLSQRTPVKLPLGSVMKLWTAAILLETRLLHAEKTFECRGSTLLPTGQTLHCLKPHGKLNVVQALGQSCNCFFAQAAKPLAYSRWESLLIAWQVLLPLSKETPQKREPAVYHFLGLTARSAMEPVRLLKLIQAFAQETGWSQKVSADTRRILRDGMALAASEGTGKALKKRTGKALKVNDASTASVPMAIKTGTVPYGTHFQSWLVGFYPVNRPEVVFVVQDLRGSSQDKAVQAAQQWLEAY